MVDGARPPKQTASNTFGRGRPSRHTDIDNRETNERRDGRDHSGGLRRSRLPRKAFFRTRTPESGDLAAVPMTLENVGRPSGARETIIDTSIKNLLVLI
jgi:hypothetical protein